MKLGLHILGDLFFNCHIIEAKKVSVYNAVLVNIAHIPSKSFGKLQLQLGVSVAW